MSTLKKDHILGAGGAAVAGGAVGAAIGAIAAGPPGLAIGAAAGGALGAVIGNRASEAADTRGDLGHFQQIHDKMPYYLDGHAWSDYEPAYRYGLDTFPAGGGQDPAQAEPALDQGWMRARDGSRLSWAQARPAVEHVWRELDEALRQRTGPDAP